MRDPIEQVLVVDPKMDQQSQENGSRGPRGRATGSAAMWRQFAPGSTARGPVEHHEALEDPQIVEHVIGSRKVVGGSTFSGLHIAMEKSMRW